MSNGQTQSDNQVGNTMISVIIPAYNEEGTIGNTVAYLRSTVSESNAAEVIVVDGASTDNTISEARAAGAVVIQCSTRGRSVQMNKGARESNGEVLYFLHADSVPPATFIDDIRGALQKGFNIGCYRLRFDHDHWFLHTNAWFTRFDVNAFRYGDQSLFVTRELFDKAGGFCESHMIMEDHHIVKKLRRYGKFLILPKPVVTSARKYIANGVFKMQAVCFLIFILYRLGYSQQYLLNIYKRFVRQDKL